MAITSYVREKQQKTEIKLGNLYRVATDGSIVMSLVNSTKSHTNTSIQVFRCVLLYRGDNKKPSHIGDVYDNLSAEEVEEYKGELGLISN